MASLLKSSITFPRSSAYPNSTPTSTTTMASPVHVTKIGSSSLDFKGLKIQCPKHTLAYSKCRQQRFVVRARVSPVVEETWDSLVLDSNSSALVLVFLFRDRWCGQSRLMEPIVDRISNYYDEDVMRCFALDVRESGSIPMRYRFRTTPTIMFFKFGEKKCEIQGQITEQELNEKIQELLSHRINE